MHIVTLDATEMSVWKYKYMHLDKINTIYGECLQLKTDMMLFAGNTV